MQELQKTRAQLLFEKLNKLITWRNHELVSGEYLNASSPITVRCLIHNVTNKTTVTNYKRCKTGLSCCGKQKQSEATVLSNIRRTKKKPIALTINIPIIVKAGEGEGS